MRLAQKVVFDIQNLRKIREARHLLQKNVADALGISRAAYSNYETGLRCPDLEMLQNLADFFHISVDELLNHTPKNASKIFLYPEEQALIRKYRTLSQKGKKRTLKQIDFELDMERLYECEPAPALYVAEDSSDENPMLQDQAPS